MTWIGLGSFALAVVIETITAFSPNGSDEKDKTTAISLKVTALLMFVLYIIQLLEKMPQ